MVIENGYTSDTKLDRRFCAERSLGGLLCKAGFSTWLRLSFADF